MFSWIWRQEEIPKGEAPLFYEVLQPLKVQHGDQAVFRAKVLAHPVPKILWYHTDKELPSTVDFLQEFEVATGTAQLTIKEVFIDDRGLYRAVALNEFGKDETTGFLTVEDFEILEKSELRQAPRITVPLMAQVLQLSSAVVLRAKFEAFPPPTIKWYKDLKEIKPSTEFIIETIEDETTLRIDELYEDDKGEYQVRVMNEVGEARSAATVVVVHPAQKPDLQPPQFIKTLTPQIVPEGEVAILEALVTAKPEAKFTWYRHGEELHTDEDLEIQITSGGNKTTLVIGELYEDDSGDYTVTATNPVGKASSTATLLVEGEMAEEFDAPEFCPPLTPIRVMDGEDVRFTCKVKGHPTPKISWFHNGRPISHHREVKVMQTPDGRVGLLIHEVFPEDSGDYTCIARNKAGEARTTTSLAVESYEYQPDSEAATMASISDKQILSGTASEDEILDIEKDSESDSEAGSSPFFINRLEKMIEVKEKSPVRMVAKTSGYPKPKITWYVDEQPLEPSELFNIENFEDGTVALNIPYTVLDHCGIYVCEAMNRNGIDQTITQLVVVPEEVPEEHTEGISAQYRKPEWVTRMEVLKETMEAERTAPVFTQEITNGRVQEMDNFTFIASFKGNPKPEITWYCNDRLLQQSQVHQMRIRGDKAMLTVVQSSPENKGEYVCRAVNNVGETTCKATLEIIELTYEDKLKIDDERYAALQIQHAAEFMRLKEVERKEKENQEHKVRMTKMTEERKLRQIEKERELEEARKNIYKKEVKQKVEKIIKEEVKEEVIYKTPTERRIAEVYSGWKKPVELEQAYPVLEPEQFAPNQVPGVKCFVRVSETSMKGDEVVNEIAPQFFEDEQVIAEIAKVHNLLKNRVRINQIWSMFRAGEFKHLQQPKVQTALVKICEYIGHHRNVSMVLAEETEEQAKTHPVGLKALLRMITHAKDIKQEEFFKEVIPREMGKWSQATQELQKVSQMIKQGIENEEIIATCEAGKLPSLKKPETQLPLINIVEKQGYTVMVAQVLVEEATRDAKEERVLAEKAWQMVHEDELVEAAVVKVEPEPAPLIEQKTIDIQEGLTPKHTAQSSIQETFEHTTYETPMPITHKPAAQTTVETDKLEKPSVTEVFVDDTNKIPKEIKLSEEVEEITSQSHWRKPKRLPAQEEKPGEIVKLTPVKREAVITEVDKINEFTLKPLTNLETTMVQKDEIKPSKEEKQEPKKRKIKKVDVTLKEKEKVMEEIITDKEETHMELTIEKQKTKVSELQEIKPQTVNWRKPKKLPLTEDEPQEVVTLKPFTKEITQIEDEKIEVDLKPKKEVETKVVQRDEVEKLIEFKKKPKKVMEVKEETECLTEVQEEATKKTQQLPSDEIPAEPCKPIEKIQMKEMEEIKPDKVTWRKPKRLPSAEEKPEEVVTLKPFTKEIIKTDKEKIEVTLKPLSEDEKEVIERVEMKKPDEIKQMKPKKMKDKVTSDVQKGILQQDVVESVEETILPIKKGEHLTIITTEDALAKSIVTTTVVKEKKIEEEVTPELVSWRKSKRHPAPVEKPEEIVKLKPVKREKATIEEETQVVILKPIPQIETTVKIDEKVEIKKVKILPKQIITKEVQEQHAPEQPLLSPKEEVMVYDDFHVPDSEYPKVTTTEEVLLKPDSTITDIFEEKEVKIEKKRSKKKVVEKIKTTEETMDISTDEALYIEEINEFKLPKEEYIAPKVLELDEASIQETPTIIQDIIEKDTSIEAIELQQTVMTEEIAEITDEKQMKRIPRKILPERVDSTEKVQLKPVSQKPKKEERKPEKVELKPFLMKDSDIQEVSEIVEEDTSVSIVKKLKEKLPEEDIQETVTESVEYFKDTISKEIPKITEHTTEHITAKITKPEQMIDKTKIILSLEKTEALQPLTKEETAAREGVQEIEIQEITVVEEPRVIQEKIEEKKIIKKKKVQKKVEIEDTDETSKIPEQISKLIEVAPLGIEDTEVVIPFSYVKQTVKVEEEPTRQMEIITITEVPTEIHKQDIVIKKTVHKPKTKEEIHTTQIEGKQLLTQEAQQVIQEQISTLVAQTIQQQLVKTLVEQESTIEEVQETEQQRKAPVKLDIKPAKSIKEVIEVDVVEPFQVDLPEKKRLQPKEEVGYKTHKATVSKVHSELSIPGFKALVNLATESFVDLEKIDLLPLERQKYEEDIVKLSFNLKKGVQVEELITMMKEDEFPSLKPVEDQAAILDVVDRFEHAAVNRVFVKECEDRPQKSIGTKSIIKSIETGKQTMEQVIMDVSKEFGPSSQPVREIAAVGQLLQEGVKCSEVLTLLDAGMLPALQMPETQATLVTMVTDRGHISSVCEVLVAESAAELTKELPHVNTARMTEVQDKLIKATAESVNVKTFTKEMVPGVKAYIKMAQEQKVDIQEMVEKSDIKEEIKREMIKIADMIKHGVIEKDVFSLMEAGEFPEFLKSETQAKLLNVVDDFGHTAIVSDIIIEQAVQQSEQSVGAKSFIRMTEQENIDLERILTSSLPKEITENQESIEDITKITFMMKQGIPSKDVITMMEAGQLPGLTMPWVQIPLVKVVESEGHTAIVCQVLIEESVKSIQADLPKVDVATIASVKTVLETASAAQVLVQERELMERVSEQKVEVTVNEVKVQETTIEFQKYPEKEEKAKVSETEKEPVTVSQVKFEEMTEELDSFKTTHATLTPIITEVEEKHEASVNLITMETKPEIQKVNVPKSESLQIIDISSEQAMEEIKQIIATKDRAEVTVIKPELIRADQEDVLVLRAPSREKTFIEVIEEPEVPKPMDETMTEFQIKRKSKQKKPAITQEEETLVVVKKVEVVETKEPDIIEEYQEPETVHEIAVKEATKQETIVTEIEKLHKPKIAEIEVKMIIEETKVKEETETEVVLKRKRKLNKLELEQESVTEEKLEFTDDNITINRKPRKIKPLEVEGVETTLTLQKTEEVTSETEMIATQEKSEEPTEVQESYKVEETSSEFQIKRKTKAKKPIEQITEEEVEVSFIKTVEKQKPQTPEVTESVTIVEEPETVEEQYKIEETSTEFQIKRKPKAKKPIEVVAEEEVAFTLKKSEEKQEPQKPEVTESITIVEKPEEPEAIEETYKTEETSTEFQIKRKPKAKKPIEVVAEEEIAFTLNKTEEKQEPQKPEVTESITIVEKPEEPEAIEEPYKVEETSTEFQIKRKPKAKKPTEVVSEEETAVTLMKTEEKHEPQNPEVTQSITIFEKPEEPEAIEEPYKIEETSSEFQIKRKPKVKKPIEVVAEEEVAFTLNKKEEKQEIQKPEVTESITIVEKPEEPEAIEEPYKIEETNTEFQIKRKPKAKKPIEVVAEEDVAFTLKKTEEKHEPQKPEVTESVTFIEKPEEPETVEEPYKIEESSSEFQIKRKPKAKKPTKTVEEEVAFTLQQTKEKSPETSEVSESVTIEEVTEEAKETYKIEETSADFQIKRKPKIKPEKVTEEEEEVKFTLKKKKETEEPTEFTESVTIEEKLEEPEEVEEPYRIEETSADFQIKRKPKAKKPKKLIVEEEEEVAFTLKKRDEKKESDEVSESVTLKKRETSPKKEHQEIEEHVAVRLPQAMEYTSEELTEDVKIKMKRPKRAYQIGEEETTESKVVLEGTEDQQEEIILEENQEIIHRMIIEKTEKPTTEDISQTFKIGRPKKKKYLVEDEDEVEGSFKLKKKGVVAQEGADVEENFRMRMRTSETEEDTLTENSPTDVDGEFTFQKLSKQTIKKKLQEIESSELFRIPRPPSGAPVVTQEEFSIQEAQLHIVEDTVEIAPPLDVRPGDQLRAIATYIVEDDHENAMHLVEGERVYVQECSNSDWWFVEKHLTKERGFVPAKLLAEEQSYTLYVQKRLEEKIQKLPVFDKLKKGEVARAPKILIKLEPKVVIDGQETQFVCKVEGHPRPNITWFRQTAIIKPSEEFQTFYSDDNTATLIIKEVFPEDAGMFTCVAKNQAGAAACSAELVVEGPMSDHGSDSFTASRRSLSRESSVCDYLEGIPPTFAQKAVIKTTEEGLTIELDVRLVAIPEPEITWRKDGQAVRDSERIKIIKQKDVHAYRSILVIKDTKKDDEGVYEIVVRNREGEARNTVTLNVMAPAAPEFIERLKDTTVDDDGTIRLIARVRGNPIPDVSWSRNGQKLRNEKNIVMTFEEELVVLEIRGATREKDIGKYVCTATNKMGRVTDFCQVSVGREAVTFKKGLESCVVEEFSEVILECRTSKEVECKWQKDKHKIKESERIQIERSGLTHRLTINSAHVSDAGKYKCIFEKISTWCNLTVKGSDEFIRKLEDVEVMEKEKAVLEVEVSKESAQVSWHKDGEEITDERFKTESEGGIRRLILTSATLSDEGEYTCVLGDLECSAELGVRELPAEISKKMKDQLVYKGHKASFEVELTKGDAVITWYKNDEEIKVSEHYQLSIDGKKQRLMVYNCQMDDAGFYRAVVGKSECSAVLTVELQPEGDFSKKLLSQLDVTSGSEVNFSVFITKAEYDVKWFKNQLELFETDKYILLRDENQRTLVIKSAARDDAGDYSCQLGKLISTCHLNVIVLECAPTIDRSLIQTEYVVKKGHDVTFTVPFKAEPLPTAAWIRKRKPIKESKKYLTTITENCATFTIKQVENIDCGDYRLELFNHCGDVSIDFTLKILDKPSKPGWPEILQVTDDSVTIHWRAPDDDGGRTITNYLVEYKSKSSQKWMVFNQDFSITETTTIVTHVQTNEEYCFRTSAVNEMGTSEPSEESLYVKVCEPIRPEPPTVLEQLQPVVTGLHQKVVLRCVISGTPLPTIEWYKDGQLITTNTTYENFRATLTIKETSGSSSGMYTCRAFNEAGFNECSASVLVQESPKFEWDESLQCQRLSVGDRWYIPIQVTGYPQPKVMWTRNDQPITSSHRVIIHTEEEEGHTDIAIQKLEQDDSAIFSLTAENSAGKATLSFNLRVVEQEKEVEEEIVVEHKEEIQLERPGPPNGPLQFDDVTGSSVRLTWKLSTYNGGAEITSYYIEKLEKGQKQWQNVDEVCADVTSYTVQNLNEGREYFFRIFASNVMGLSDALEGSETVFIKNPFDVPGPPNGPFDVGNLADSSLLLKWEEPDTDGGSPITGYLLERREAFKKAWQRVGQTAAEVTQMEITGLKRGSAYFFRVFAMNEVGQGPPFQPDEPITAGKKITVPSMPTGLNVIDVTSRTVTLGWAPPSTTGGADLIGYVIQSRITSESSWKMVRTVDPSVTLFCVENLREKSEYEFRVFAENPVGLSERAAMTEKVQLKTHATPPSPPTAPLEARPTGPTSLMIEWGAPESDGGAPILGYIIAIRDTKRTMWIEVGQVDANFTRLHIKELQENHEYNVRVFARNEIGTSDPLETEDPVQILRPDGFQELPEDDAAPSLSYSTTETLSWMREAGVDADIYSYARGRLLNRDEYFFKVWHQQQKRREE